ncbi:MAG: hypothetical protein ACLQVI_37110 [Polyangiaceae bacterium]
MSRLEQIAPWCAGAVIATPVLLAHYPPMADIPLHEAVVGLLRHWGDPSYIPANVYALNLGHPNQLFYFLILPLAYVFPVGTATKLIVALTLLLLPPAAARFADYLGVTRWTAVLIAPLGLGWMFFWGLLANLIGFVVYLTALPSLDRLCEKPTGRRVAIACGWVLLLHFAHDLMALTAAGTILLLTLCSWRGWRDNALRLAPGFFVVAIAVVSRVIDVSHHTAHAQSLEAFHWYPLFHKLISIPGVLYAGYEQWVRDLIFVACAIPTFLFGVERWRTRAPQRRTRREQLHHYRFEILSAALIACYFIAPVNMSSTTLIYHRFLPPAWAILTVTLAARGAPPPAWRLPRMLAAFMPFVPILVSWPRFLDADRIYKDLDAGIARMEKNSTYMVLELGPTNQYWLFSPVTGGGHIVAVLGGRGFFDFTDSPASPVILRREVVWTHMFERMDGHSYNMYPSYDLSHFRYVILHTPSESIARLVSFALEPEARLLFHQGEWTVMESTLPQVPVDSPDEPAPLPHPLSLRKRTLQAIETLEPGLGDEALPPETAPSGLSGP